MKRHILIAMGALSLTAAAQVNSPDGSGYLERSLMMLSDGNYAGCIDQATRALQLPLTAQQQSQAQLAKATAMVHTSKPEAARLLQQWLHDNAGSDQRPQALMAYGDCLYGDDYEAALAVYRQVDPESLAAPLRQDLYYRMAYSYLQLRDYDDAEACLDQLDATPRYGRAATFYRGYAAYAKGNYAAALPLMQQAALWQQEPCDMADYYIAQMQYHKGEYAEALKAATALLRSRAAKGEYLAEANRIAGEASWHLGDAATAVSYLNAYLKLTTDPAPTALYMLGVEEYNIGNYDQAIKYLEPATALGDAMSQSAYLYIGQALMKEGDYSAAALSLDKALASDFDPVVQEKAYYNFAVASMKGGKVPFGNNINTLQSFLKKFPSSAHASDVQDYIVASYLNDNNYAAALENINAMPKPTAATLKAKQRVLYLLGSKMMAADNTSLAMQYLAEADELAKYDPEVARETQLALGETALRAGNYAQAAQWLKKYLSQAPATAANRNIAYYDLAYAQFKQKQYADAEGNLQQLLANPGTLPADIVADAWARLGDCRYYQSQFASAAEAYDRAYAANPATGDYALFQKGVMQGYLRHHSDKIDILKQMQREFPASALIPDAMLEMTASYIQLGDNGTAIDVYQQLVSQYPNTAQGRQGYLQMAQTMLNDGQKAQAVKTYKEVITKFPTSEEAALAADQLKRLAAADGTLGEFMAFINSVPSGPRMEASEADALSFETAEMAYITGKGADKLVSYLNEYPNGASRAKALSLLAEHFNDAGDDDEAYKYASSLVAEFPDSQYAIDALVIKAQAEEAQGKGNLALRTWQLLQQKASTPAMLNKARLGVLRTASEISDDSAAIEAGEALMASSSLSTAARTEAAYNLGAAYSRQGNEEQARQMWQSVADRVDDVYGMRSAYSLANSYFKAKDYAQAERQAEAVANADTEHIYWMARGFILLSDIYSAQGNTYKAQQYLITLRDKYPGSEKDIFSMIDQRLK